MSENGKDTIVAEENEDVEEDANRSSENDNENHQEEDEKDAVDEDIQENDGQDVEQDTEQNQHNPNGIYIRLRGLPWGVTNKDIVDFLKDVKVAGEEKGVYIVKNKSDGKSTGEAFVELESENEVEKAFKHDKENMAHRYIEIFKATPEDAAFAMKKMKRSGKILKMRGLPFSADEDMIEEFFDGLNIKKDREGIVIVTNRNGRATGEAYVQFKTELDAQKALNRNRDKIGHRYIELFRSSFADLKRALGIRPAPYDRSGVRSRGFRNGNSLRGTSAGGWENRHRGGFRHSGAQPNARRSSRSFVSGRNSIRGSSFGNISGSDSGFGGGNLSGRQNVHSNMYCIHMRGLPYYSYENDVNDFFAPLRPVNIEIIYNKRRLHSGTANVYFASADDAILAMRKHKEQMGARYIELFYDGNTKKGPRI